eukprot:TRINITY_DN7995_c0_g2_i5.p1 TRINITY_DN7995_c0_g2~~TRINITY_DN7995_c0_g2_i5.p1  ORF type:complete len:191 (+),score=30.03 TRINITY_DN7995_c0_g2_i5:73-645(+)
MSSLSASQLSECGYGGHASPWGGLNLCLLGCVSNSSSTALPRLALATLTPLIRQPLSASTVSIPSFFSSSSSSASPTSSASSFSSHSSVNNLSPSAKADSSSSVSSASSVTSAAAAVSWSEVSLASAASSLSTSALSSQPPSLPLSQKFSITSARSDVTLNKNIFHCIDLMMEQKLILLGSDDGKVLVLS